MLFFAPKQHTNSLCLEKAFIFVLENNPFRMKERKTISFLHTNAILLEDFFNYFQF